MTTAADPVEITGDDRRVSVAVSSEQPVERQGYVEILRHDPAAIDLSFLGSGNAPLLLDHDPRRQIGVVEKISLDGPGKVLRATVRLSASPEADQVLRDIKDRIRSNVSVGYQVLMVETRGERTIVTRWKPYEVSIVSIPADETVGVGRAFDPAPGDTQQKEIVAMTEQTKLTPSHAAQIMDLGHRHGMADAAYRAVEEGTSLSDFRQKVLARIGNAPLNPGFDHETPRGGVRVPFHLGNYLRGRITNDWSDARDEREQSAELTRSARGVRGMVVPIEALHTRAPMLTTGVAGPLTTVEHRGDLFIDALRPASFAIQAGAQMVGGLTSDVSIPRETTAPAASWITEGGSIAEGNPAFDNVTLNATMLAARTTVSRKALLQGIPQMDDLLKRSINAQFASALDAAVISGSGVAPIPRGIQATVGINSFAAAGAGAVTWEEIIAAWAAVASDNIMPDSSMAWVAHPTVAAILRNTEKFAGSSGEPILGDVTEIRDGSILAGTIMGRPAFETSHASATTLTLGRMSDVLIGQFGGVDFVIDEYTGASTGTIAIYAYAFFDITVRRPQSFCVITGI
nr:phage major capsid protein [Rhodobacter kunshanensis]